MKIHNWIAIAMISFGAALVACEKQPSQPAAGGNLQEQEPAQPAAIQPAIEQPAPAATQQAPQAQVDLTILNWGPRATKAGAPFNVQADGKSIIWFEVKQVSPEMAIYFNNTELPSIAVNQQSNGISATVPQELIATPGDVQVYVMDKASGKKSETIVFKVE